MDALNPLATLAREREKLAPNAYRAYVPPRPALRPGGDLDDTTTLARVLPSAAADGEVMLLCIGGSGSLRAGMNLVMNFRTMGLYHMLILAPKRAFGR